MNNISKTSNISVLLVFFTSLISGCSLQSPLSSPNIPDTTDTPTVPTPTGTPAGPPEFDGARALEDIEYQVDLGPRYPGSEGHEQVVRWIQLEVRGAGWDTSVQEATALGHPIRNVIARRGEGGEPWVILGAHYDTRRYADQDPVLAEQDTPVPGANDGASGVAVLLELARVIPKDLDQQIWLVFFDAEDNGNIPGWDWILGSKAFVEALDGKPDQVVIVDMVADADLNLYFERNSDPELTREIWEIAADLGYADQFIQEPKYRMIDDHTPFLQAGITAIDIIDFDYPYWHTTEDSLDKVSADSLDAVGDTLLAWLLNGSDR